MLQQPDDTPTSDNDDHDLIPDTLQKSPEVRPEQPLAREAKHDKRDFGQMAKRPVKEPPAKRLTFEEPKKTDWSPIDLSHGTQHIAGSRQSFLTHEKKDLKKSLGTILNAGQREEVAKRFYKTKEHGLTKGKIKKEVGKMLKEGRLNKFEAKRILRGTKANKSSSLF